MRETKQAHVDQTTFRKGIKRYQRMYMPVQEFQRLKRLILDQIKEHESYSVQNFLDQTLNQNPDIYESDVKRALLILVRQNKLDLTNGVFTAREPRG